MARMTMIKIRFTWPLLIALLVALIIYLLRAHPSPQPKPKARRRPFVIDRDRNGHHVTGDDFAAETQRLDRDAAESAQTVYESARASGDETLERMQQRHAQRTARRARG
jgi:hypothetical protein